MGPEVGGLFSLLGQGKAWALGTRSWAGGASG